MKKIDTVTDILMLIHKKDYVEKIFFLMVVLFVLFVSIAIDNILAIFC
jgi:hypothetical protein